MFNNLILPKLNFILGITRLYYQINKLDKFDKLDKLETLKIFIFWKKYSTDILLLNP